MHSALLITTLMAASIAFAGEPAIRFGEWKPVTPGGKPLIVSYFNVVPRDDQDRIGLWFCASMGKVDAQIGMLGAHFDALPRPPAAFDGTLITGYTTNLLGRSSPIISRSSTTRLRNGSYVVLASIGPEYGAGGGLTELLPVLFASPNGQPGSWRYLGPPAGEPSADLDRRRAAKTLIRSDGGSIVELPDGRLRMYLHWDDAAGIRLACAESATVAGRWSFVRTPTGAIRDLAPSIPGVTWIFPSVTAIGGRWLLTGGNAWPPKQIYGAVSANGVDFTTITANDRTTPQALVTPGAIRSDADTMKCLRVAWNDKRQVLDVLANPRPRSSEGWVLYHCEATVDPQLFALSASASTAR